MSFALGNKVNQEIITNNIPYGNVSDRYIATSTQSIIDEMNQYREFTPVGFNSVNVHKADKSGSQKHVVMLEAEDAEMIDGSLRIVLFNSLDKSTSIRMYLGYYRDTCSNDCVFGDDAMNPIVLKHTKIDWKSSIAKLMDEYENIQKNTQQMIQRMINTYVSYGDIGRYNNHIAKILNQDITGYVLDPSQLNVAHREDDIGKNAWLMYQRSQYNIINGGIDRVIKDTTNTADDNAITISRTHKITDETKKIKYNRLLHKEAMKLVS